MQNLLSETKGENERGRKGEIKSLDTLLKTLSTYGAKHIARVLTTNTIIRRVKLDGFNLKDDGAIQIAEALKRNRIITDLSMCSNSIGDEGAKAIAEALRVNRT